MTTLVAASRRLVSTIAGVASFLSRVVGMVLLCLVVVYRIMCLLLLFCFDFGQSKKI
jgi:hypothetical protein